MSIQVQTVVCIDDTTEDTTPVPLSQLSPTLQLSPAQPPPQLSPAQLQPSPPFPQLSPAQPQPSPPQLSPFPQLSPLPHLPVPLRQPSSSLPEPPLPWAFQPSSSVAPVASLPLSPTHATPLAMSTTETSAEVQHCTLLEIPHHLKSKASSAGNYKKAARILAATMFTVDERKSSTLSGGNGKNKLDPGRIILIHG